ncbi:MAG: hypothetical protein JWQ62_1636 [Lacunisphaera sp.]|nr:hypothetical protein [Lacunisphaera sp.]
MAIIRVKGTGQRDRAPRLFLLSPAHMGGLRAKLLLNPKAPFPLAREFRRHGLPLADVFTFTSGLYFRGKITYANHFAHAIHRDIVRVITSNAGLVDPREVVGPGHVAAYGETEIAVTDPKYHEPLRRDAQLLARRLGKRGEVILLGSIATPKYRDVLLDVFGDRLLFPIEFVGRGDMSRGALLLRAVTADRELVYAPVRDAALTGRRAVRANLVISAG